MGGGNGSTLPINGDQTVMEFLEVLSLLRSINVLRFRKLCTHIDPFGNTLLCFQWEFNEDCSSRLYLSEYLSVMVGGSHPNIIERPFSSMTSVTLSPKNFNGLLYSTSQAIVSSTKNISEENWTVSFFLIFLFVDSIKRKILQYLVYRYNFT